MRKWIQWTRGLGAILIILSGCGSIDTRSTVEQLTNARVAVETAEKMGAENHAPDDLRHAQDALAIAKDAYANQAFERAFEFAKKATIYARVAQARTEQGQAEKKVNELKEQLEKVKRDTEGYVQSDNVSLTEPAAQATVAPEQVGSQATAVPATQEDTQP
ncbi:DUF4398 domain-containing protein [candidate division FCPU426 bacterium]|nr:DUF4398 domain-containing protein [candidate division FCPU426 bacterium]